MSYQHVCKTFTSLDILFTRLACMIWKLHACQVGCMSLVIQCYHTEVLQHFAAIFIFGWLRTLLDGGGGRRLVGVVLWHLQALLACTESYRFNWNGHNLKLSTTENGFLSTWIQMTCEPVMVFLLSKCNHLLFLVISEEKNFKSTSQTFHNTGKMLES